ncbi:hypothetical protein M0813_28157 [Anaeramoeba flamelloides]|uniref:DRBM domain-containing protein n=1 Tax=Anaeramoeba flamelloides TaxID=1746091 RepID=A0ABQ8XUP3_9EUKA|nr:hypothetical protein M0813_28157 [Anaeramoeba flamelloides]
MIPQTQLHTQPKSTKIEQPFSLRVVVLIDRQIVFKQILICDNSSQTFTEILRIINNRWDPRPRIYDTIELNTITNKHFFQYSLKDAVVSCCRANEIIVICNLKEYLNYLNNDPPKVLLQFIENNNQINSNHKSVHPKKKKKKSNETPEFVTEFIEELYLGHVSDISNEKEYLKSSLSKTTNDKNIDIGDTSINNYCLQNPNSEKKLNKKKTINRNIKIHFYDILNKFAIRQGSKPPTYKLQLMNKNTPNSRIIATSIFLINNNIVKKTGIGLSKELAKSKAAYNICLELFNLKIISSLASLFDEKCTERIKFLQSPYFGHDVENEDEDENDNDNENENNINTNNTNTKNVNDNIKKKPNYNPNLNYNKKNWKGNKEPYQILFEFAQKGNWTPININYEKKNQLFICEIEISNINNRQYSISSPQSSKILAKQDASLKMLNTLGFYFIL